MYARGQNINRFLVKTDSKLALASQKERNLVTPKKARQKVMICLNLFAILDNEISLIS